MCYTCGCELPYNDMGDQKNLTEKDFEEAGTTAAIGAAGTLKAKQNMLHLLKEELEKGELAKPKKKY